MVNEAGQDTVTPRKRRGPAPTGKGLPITVRVQPDQLTRLDRYIAGQADTPSRPEAIRRLMLAGLDAAQ
jgi:hypothetical protein